VEQQRKRWWALALKYSNDQRSSDDSPKNVVY